MGEEKRSPSEVLRRMLDERNVEWWCGALNEQTSTWWESNGARWYAFETDNGRLSVNMDWGTTPEQAIAATVGNSTDLSKRLRDVNGLHASAELFGFDWTGESDWDWHDVACAMADAVDAATVGNVGSVTTEEVLRQLVAQLGDAAGFHFASKYVDCIVDEYAGKFATAGNRSCASCPEMDNPDSYIVHLHRALEVTDEGVGTCKLVDNDSGPDMHCTACGGEIDDEYRYFMDSWGYSRCPHCGARIIEEEAE